MNVAQSFTQPSFLTIDSIYMQPLKSSQHYQGPFSSQFIPPLSSPIGQKTQKIESTHHRIQEQLLPQVT